MFLENNMENTKPRKMWIAIAGSAYKAYATVTDNKNYQGLPMPKFEDLPDKIQGAWVAAAIDVFQTIHSKANISIKIK